MPRRKPRNPSAERAVLQVDASESDPKIDAKIDAFRLREAELFAIDFSDLRARAESPDETLYAWTELSSPEYDRLEQAASSLGTSLPRLLADACAGADGTPFGLSMRDGYQARRARMILELVDDMRGEPFRGTPQRLLELGLPPDPPPDHALDGTSPWASMFFVRPDGLGLGARASRIIERGWKILDVVMEDWPGWLEWRAEPLLVEFSSDFRAEGGRLDSDDALDELGEVVRQVEVPLPATVYHNARLRAARACLPLSFLLRRRALGMRVVEDPEGFAWSVLDDLRRSVMPLLSYSQLHGNLFPETLDDALSLLEEMDEAQAQLLEIYCARRFLPVHAPSVLARAREAVRGYKIKSFDVWSRELDAVSRAVEEELRSAESRGDAS